MWSHLNAARAAAIILPVATACTQSGVLAAGVPTPAPSRGAAAVVPTAEQYIGVPYKWGGSSPRTGFDCSGYVKYVFAKHGVNLPRTSRSQALVGSRVRLDYDDLRAGDLIMFAEPGQAISHVAIYAGNKRILHSSSSGHGVRLDNLRSDRGVWFEQNAVVARRVAAASEGRGIVFDLVADLRSAGVRVDLPMIADVIGDLAPKP